MHRHARCAFFTLALLTAGFACGPGGSPEEDDADQDGVPASSDCNDSDPAIYPDAPELCDGKDNDCDTAVDEDEVGLVYADRDGDGYGDPEDSLEACQAAEGYVDNADDCDDGDEGANPDAKEQCNGRDDDCDGKGDEDFDKDNDGYTTCEEDCDDGDPDLNPGADEVCDGEDTDCDGRKGSSSLDEDDDDGDGAPNCGDCAPDDDAVYPGAREKCDGADNDCDGQTDEGVSTAYCPDGDGDGFGDADAIVPVCEGDGPEGYVTKCTDCDDADPSANPGETEVCDGVDNDCNGQLTREEQQDGDKDGSPKCVDCDDLDPSVGKGFDENSCDGKDNDCDGQTDEGFEGLDAEPNGTMESAIDLGTLDTTTQACATVQGTLPLGDIDYFKFASLDQALDDWSISASVQVPEGASICVDMVDDQGTILNSRPSCAQGPDAATVEIDFISGDQTRTFWINVHPEGGNDLVSCEPYTLTACGY